MNKLLTIKDILNLPKKDYHNFFVNYFNAPLADIFRILGLDDMDIQSAKGSYIYLRNKKKILDTTSGIGVLALGHNHPKILNIEKKSISSDLIDIQKFGINKFQAALAYNLSLLLPDPLNTSFFTVSGAEAIEAGIKLITRVQPNFKNKFITFYGDYHGKTHGSLSVTDSENFKQGFHMSIPDSQILKIPHGDIKAFKKAIFDNSLPGGKNSIAAVIIEPIQGQTLFVPYKDFLNDLSTECKKHNILLFIDEIKCGMGRTGSLFSFMEQGIVPDVLAISKAMGGGKRAIGAMVTSSKLSKKAYGQKNTCSIHSSTFGGIGTSCLVAIETLNIISKKSFLNSVNKKGDYFKDKLERLIKKHPNIIEKVNGKGLFLGLILKPNLSKKFLQSINKNLSKNIDVIITGSILSNLYKKHNILIHFTPPRPDMLVFMPPLIITYKQIDDVIKALDITFSDGINKLILRFINQNLIDYFKKSY